MIAKIKVGLSFHIHLIQEVSANSKAEHYFCTLLTVYGMALQFFKANSNLAKQKKKKKANRKKKNTMVTGRTEAVLRRTDVRKDG